MSEKKTSKTSKKEPKYCGCGCGGMTKGGRYLPGHDAKHKGKLIRMVKAQGPDARAAGETLVGLGWKTPEWVVSCESLPEDEDADDEPDEPDEPDKSLDPVGPVLFRKDGPCPLLAPDAKTPFSIDGVEFPTVMHYLLSVQIASDEGQEAVRTAANVGWARRKNASLIAAGDVADGFELYDELNNATFAKIAANDKARKQLMATGSVPLGWDHGDHEMAFGGENLVGEIMEEARSAFR